MSVDWLLTDQSLVRVGAFAIVFAAIAAWEMRAPRRALSVARGYRWLNNLGVLVTGALLVRLLLPAGAIGASLVAAERGWGLLNQAMLPAWLEVVAAIVLLDFAIWAQHVLFHKAPPLWRLHRMHHADLDFDLTTGLRFHPLELLVSMLIKMAVVMAMGAPALAVLLFEVLLNATSMLSHANARLPPALDRALRWLIVTPDMHRVHHSWHRDETDSNYGFNLSWWDRLFGTYRAQPRDGHRGMTIGLAGFRDPAGLRLDRLLVQPFVGDASSPAPAARRD